MKLLLAIVRARFKSMVILVILLVLNVALACYVTFRQAPRTEALRIQRNARQRLLATGGDDLSAIYRQGITDLALFLDIAPPRKSFARVIGEILEMAHNNGLAVSGITYKPDPVAHDGLIDYAFSFSVVGKYAGVKSYIADLQHFREMVVVDQFSLVGGRMSEEVVDLKLHLTVYLRAVPR